MTRYLIPWLFLVFSSPGFAGSEICSAKKETAMAVDAEVSVQCAGVQTGRIVDSDFRPYPLLANRHLQTIWPRLFHRQSRQKFDRQRIELADGDFLDLDWFPDNSESRNIVILVHGLGGSSSSHYIKRIGVGLIQSGFRVVVFNLRGATEPNRTPRTYHSGETGDLEMVINLIRAQYQSESLYLAGFSLGGNVILKWLGENPRQDLVAKAVAVSPPFDLSAVSRRLDQGFSRMYRNIILRGLRKHVKSRQAMLQSEVDLEAAYNAKTFTEYDDAVTAPLNGFRDAQDYYSKSSCRQFLDTISRPVLIIHSKDDPFSSPDIIPSKSELGPGVILELSDRGGHLGFVSGRNGLAVDYWLPHRIADFFSSP